MKKIVSFLVVFIFMMNIAVPVFADNTPSTATTTPTSLTITGSTTPTTAETTTADTAGTQVSDAGILPDSPFYFVDRVFEQIILFFTFSPEKKAQELLADANERLAEAQVMTDDGKQDLAIQTSQAYVDTVQQAQVQIVIASGDGKVSGTVYNTVTSAVYGLKDRSLVAVVYGLDISQRHAAQVLLRVLAKAPEQARKGLMNAFTNVIKHQLDDEAMIYVTIDGRTVSLAVYNENHHLKTAMTNMGARFGTDGSKPDKKDKEHGKNPNSSLDQAANTQNGNGMNPSDQPKGLAKKEEKNSAKNSGKNRGKNNSSKDFQQGDNARAQGTVSPETGSWSFGNGSGNGKNMMQRFGQDGNNQDD